MLLYVITDQAFATTMSIKEQVTIALKNGVTCVQVREKTVDDNTFLRVATEIVELCQKYDVPCIINDNVKVAITANASGVHIGQEDMDVAQVRQLVGDKMMIGVSVNNVAQALLAQQNGADYLGIGAVFQTKTKLDATVVKSETIKAICDAVTIPTVAIGGITSSNIMKLAGLGLDGVAVISAIFGAIDIASATANLKLLATQMITKE